MDDTPGRSPQHSGLSRRDFLRGSGVAAAATAPATPPLLEADEDKANSAYMDSLAWVLFKKKNYAEAKKILLETVKSEDAQHVEIYDHLAEVYVALGQTDKAVETWKKGLTCKPLGKRDEQRKIEVEKKVKKLEKKD